MIPLIYPFTQTRGYGATRVNKGRRKGRRNRFRRHLWSATSPSRVLQSVRAKSVVVWGKVCSGLGQGLRWFGARSAFGRQTMPGESASHVLTGQNAWARSVTEKQTVPKSLTDLVLKNDRPCPEVRWSGDVVAYTSRTVPARERSLDSFVLLSRSLKYLLQDENGIRTSQCGHRDADQKDWYRCPSSRPPISLP